jgi:hypothetical protein
MLHDRAGTTIAAIMAATGWIDHIASPAKADRVKQAA